MSEESTENNVNLDGLALNPVAGRFYLRRGTSTRSGYFLVAHIGGEKPWLAWPAQVMGGGSLGGEQSIHINMSGNVQWIAPLDGDNLPDAKPLVESDIQPAPGDAQLALCAAVVNRHGNAEANRNAYEERSRYVEQIRAEHAEFKTRITDRLHELANDERWCSTFDDEMEEFGLPRRTQNWNVDISLDDSLTIQVQANSESAAEAAVTREKVEEAIREYMQHSYFGWSIHGTEVADD